MICAGCNSDVDTIYVCGCGKMQCNFCSSCVGCCGSAPSAVDHIRVVGDLITPENDEVDEDGVAIEEPTPLYEGRSEDPFSEWQDTGGGS